MEIITVLAVLFALPLAYLAYQWIYEIRFNLRKKIKSFDDYGRKRGLLRIKTKRMVLITTALLFILASFVLLYYLVQDFYYYWPIGVPYLVFNAVNLAIFIHEKSFNNLTIDHRFLDSEYFNVLDAEKNIESFLKEIDRLNETLVSTKNRVHEKIQDSAQYFNSFQPADYFDPQFLTIENQAFTQMNDQKGIVQTLKENFLVIAQEYIVNQRKVQLSQSNAINISKIADYFSHIKDIEIRATKTIITWIQEGVKTKRLKSLNVYGDLIQHLKALGYEINKDDVLVALKNYPADSDEKKQSYIEILYAYDIANVQFFNEFVVPNEITWLLSKEFYSHFKANEIKEIFAHAVKSKAGQLINEIIKSLNPEMIAYLSDIVAATGDFNEITEKIQHYDHLLQKMNQFLSVYNATENYFNVLNELRHSESELNEYLPTVKTKDFSTPSIVSSIEQKYLHFFDKYRPHFIVAFEFYFAYQKMIENSNATPLLKEKVLRNFLLENIFRLNLPLLKVVLSLFVFNLYAQGIKWHEAVSNQPLADAVSSFLELDAIGIDLNQVQPTESRSLFQNLVVPIVQHLNIHRATLDQMIMRSEIQRETLDLVS